jgi:molybdopterin molybdotransferase
MASPPDDVRMRGFRERIPLGAALERIREAVPPLGRPEAAAVRDALGRIAVEDVIAPRPLPPFDRSAMDGYAVKADRTFPATSYDPVVLEVIGESLPGAPFGEPLSGPRAVRIMTGAPIPEGADAVVPAEFAEEARGFVRIAGPVTPGKHVGRIGEDLAAGAVAVPVGRILRPQDLGLLGALGLESIRVAPRPRAAILATGDEIVRAGTEPGPFRIHDADTPLLAGLVERWGGRVGPCSLQPDDPARIRRALLRVLRSPAVDLVLLAGGTSVGAEDHAPGVLADLGSLLFHGVALRPAGPVGFGVAEGKPVLLLPGNPVSCLAAFDLLAGPCLRRLQGLAPAPPYPRARLPLARRLASVAGRADYARVALGPDGVEPVAVSGASILTTAVRADGWVLVPAEVEGWDAGTPVEVHLYQG